MKFQEFVKLVQRLPVIESGILLAGQLDSGAIKVQLSRWVKAGKLIQLKRGVYLLNSPYRKEDINEYYLASVLKKPSYISLEKAMEYHNLIPEGVYVYTSLTTKRPGRFKTEFGDFEYRHIRTSLFWGYEPLTFDGKTMYMATPEKAMLDFFYFNHIKVTPDYLESLRLQHMEIIDSARLLEYAERFKKPMIVKAAKILKEYVDGYKKEEVL